MLAFRSFREIGQGDVRAAGPKLSLGDWGDSKSASPLSPPTTAANVYAQMLTLGRPLSHSWPLSSLFWGLFLRLRQPELGSPKAWVMGAKLRKIPKYPHRTSAQYRYYTYRRSTSANRSPPYVTRPPMSHCLASKGLLLGED